MYDLLVASDQLAPVTALVVTMFTKAGADDWAEDRWGRMASRWRV
jgi:hypothetical protein